MKRMYLTVGDTYIISEDSEDYLFAKGTKVELMALAVKNGCGEYKALDGDFKGVKQLIEPTNVKLP
jgi:hypothetical protein